MRWFSKRSSGQPAPISIGSEIDGRYEVLGVLGQGGFGTVYRARHVLLERIVAIKVLHADVLAAKGSPMRAAFEREARLTSLVNHPHAVSVYDFGVFGAGTPYLAMEYLDARPLSAVLAQEGGYWPVERVYALAVQISDALAHAHALGIIHLDLKPDNIMLLRGSAAAPGVNLSDETAIADFAKVVDFGVARLANAIKGAGATDDDLGNEIAGSPGFMAPEHLRGEALDARADIYAFGVCLYEMLCGVHPFGAASGVALLERHLYEAPVPLNDARPDVRVSAELERIVMRCIEREPRDRYGSMLELMNELHHCVMGVREPASVPVARSPAVSMAQMLQVYDAARSDFDSGNFAAAFERLNGAVSDGARDSQLIHLAVLSLARAGAPEQAQAFIERFGTFLADTEDNAALAARLKKDRYRTALTSGSDDAHELGVAARDAYLTIGKRSSGLYPTINAATLSCWIGEHEVAEVLASHVIAMATTAPRDDWIDLTLAEALLLLGQIEPARAALARAAQRLTQVTPPSQWRAAARNTAMMGTAYQQLRTICEVKHIDVAVLDAIAPRLVVYVDVAPLNGFSPVHIRAKEAPVRAAMEALLVELRVGQACGSLRSPAELLFAEAVLDAGALFHVVLPYGLEDFRAAVIEPAGAHWCARFDRLIDRAVERAGPVLVLGERSAAPVGNAALLAHAAKGQAQLCAAQLGTDTRQIVLAATQADEPGARLLDVSGLVSARSVAGTTRDREAPQLRVFVVARLIDVVRMSEVQARSLLIAWWHALTTAASRAEQRALHCDNFGDRALATFASVAAAAAFARDLTVGATANVIRAACPHYAGIRVFVHCSAHAPQQGGPRNGAGRELLRALAMVQESARDAMLVSEIYAALLVGDGVSPQQCRYAGEQQLADGLGRLRLYNLS